jgi:hypothetical protein
MTSHLLYFRSPLPDALRSRNANTRQLNLGLPQAYRATFSWLDHVRRRIDVVGPVYVSPLNTGSDVALADYQSNESHHFGIVG